MKNKQRVKKAISKSRGKNFQKIFIILALCLGLFILILYLNSKYFSKKTNNETKPEAKSEITSTITQQPTPTTNKTKTNKENIYSSNLGFSIKILPKYFFKDIENSNREEEVIISSWDYSLSPRNYVYLNGDVKISISITQSSNFDYYLKSITSSKVTITEEKDFITDKGYKARFYKYYRESEGFGDSTVIYYGILVDNKGTVVSSKLDWYGKPNSNSLLLDFTNIIKSIEFLN